MLFDKDLADITEEDILGLERDAASEERHLEYKRDIWGDSSEAKREFLKDVSAMANVGGGLILVGIEEFEPAPKAPRVPRIYGLAVGFNEDKESLRLNQMLEEGLRPRLPKVDMREIAIPSKGTSVFGLRVPRSWMTPHGIWLNKYGKFYARSSAGTYQMDVDELRQAFLFSQNLPARVRTWVREREKEILSGQTPVSMYMGTAKALLIVHVAPLASFGAPLNEDMLVKWAPEQDVRHAPLDGRPESGTFESRFNLDGYISHRNRGKGIFAYTQIFRNGCIEAVHADMIRRTAEGEEVLYANEVRAELERRLQGYLELIQHLGVTLPAHLFITLSSAKGLRIQVSDEKASGTGHSIQREVLHFPEIEVRPHHTVSELLQPFYRLLWQSFGFAEPPSSFWEENE